MAEQMRESPLDLCVFENLPQGSLIITDRALWLRFTRPEKILAVREAFQCTCKVLRQWAKYIRLGLRGSQKQFTVLHVIPLQRDAVPNTQPAVIHQKDKSAEPL